MLCPKCNKDFDNTLTICPDCDIPLENAEKWIMIGYIADKLSADFAIETLKSSEIPAVTLSKSGFFGNIGLTLYPIFESKQAMFELSVPFSCKDEAKEILDMTLGEQWQEVN